MAAELSTIGSTTTTVPTATSTVSDFERQLAEEIAVAAAAAFSVAAAAAAAAAAVPQSTTVHDALTAADAAADATTTTTTTTTTTRISGERTVALETLDNRNDTNANTDTDTNITDTSHLPVVPALVPAPIPAPIPAPAVVPALIPPPRPLPAGWVLRAARSQPNHYFYYHQETGVSSWDAPAVMRAGSSAATTAAATTDSTRTVVPDQALVVDTIPTDTNGTLKSEQMDDSGRSKKKQRRSSLLPLDSSSTLSSSRLEAVESGTTSTGTTATATTTAKTKSGHTTKTKRLPTKVRVLHILKKHKDSRKPTTWRVQGAITITKDEARAELTSLLELLRETQSDPDELRATMEELARTESDCSSYKRGGDLGFFETKKMQPAFEHAAFAMEIGELSRELVETSSGLHILLRIG